MPRISRRAVEQRLHHLTLDGAAVCAYFEWAQSPPEHNTDILNWMMNSPEVKTSVVAPSRRAAKQLIKYVLARAGSNKSGFVIFFPSLVALFRLYSLGNLTLEDAEETGKLLGTFYFEGTRFQSMLANETVGLEGGIDIGKETTDSTPPAFEPLFCFRTAEEDVFFGVTRAGDGAQPATLTTPGGEPPTRVYTNTAYIGNEVLRYRGQEVRLEKSNESAVAGVAGVRSGSQSGSLRAMSAAKSSSPARTKPVGVPFRSRSISQARSSFQGRMTTPALPSATLRTKLQKLSFAAQSVGTVFDIVSRTSFTSLADFADSQDVEQTLFMAYRDKSGYLEAWPLQYMRTAFLTDSVYYPCEPLDLGRPLGSLNTPELGRIMVDASEALYVIEGTSPRVLILLSPGKTISPSTVVSHNVYLSAQQTGTSPRCEPAPPICNVAQGVLIM